MDESFAPMSKGPNGAFASLAWVPAPAAYSASCAASLEAALGMKPVDALPAAAVVVDVPGGMLEPAVGVVDVPKVVPEYEALHMEHETVLAGAR